MKERTDINGTWRSEDGVSWLLVAPSAAFEADRAAIPKPQPRKSLEEILKAKGIVKEEDF